ncbi:MAG: hypothetical protein ACAI44_29430 [Candidatus Sericytochromatia bacterium]
MAAPDVKQYIEESRARMRRELDDNRSRWTAASQLVKEYMEQIETDQEIISICMQHRVILLRELDLTELGYRDRLSTLKIMRYAIGDYVYNQLREHEYHLSAELESSMNAI